MGQVNWRKVGLIVAWWLLGPFPLIAAACFIYWQGVPAVRAMPAVQICTPLLLPQLASSTGMLLPHVIAAACFMYWQRQSAVLAVPICIALPLLQLPSSTGMVCLLCKSWLLCPSAFMSCCLNLLYLLARYACCAPVQICIPLPLFQSFGAILTNQILSRISIFKLCH